jgi:16S rRNA (guanine527-N7)-methyltransferase
VADVSPVLIDLLTTARARGFLGPAPVERHIRHAKGFVLVAGQPPDRFLDLGAGGGIPGLFLLLAWPEASGVLLDSSQRRTEFLRDSTTTLGLEQRAVVLRARAEEAGRDPDWRGRFPLVVARGFGRPAVTAECGSPFLAEGGRLIVSDPPTACGGDAELPTATDAPPPAPRPVAESGPTEGGVAPDRWPRAGLAILGLVAEDHRELAEGTFRVLAQREPFPERFPRRTGVPRKRPLF